MTRTFTVSPDFPPDHISGWYVLNTFLQRQTGEHIHLELYDTFDQQRAAIAAGGIDLIYANPFDAATLVRDHGFVAVARPDGVRDEAVVVVPEGSPVQKVEDLRPGCRVASTDDPDVRMIGMIMLEPADLGPDTIVAIERPTYVLVAKALIMGDADVGVFLADAYDGLSGTTRSALRPLVASQIGVISHMLMVGPALVPQLDVLRELVLGMHDDPAQRSIVEGLGFDAWLPVDHEETEFMIDLMDTLLAD
ncbi:MAG: phosphate/phosphite/phosphonate ABC transporter substrate-binding protein [Acidimicrobiales bacterium]